MTDRYVGIGGNDGNNGLSWANRKLTLTGAEDTPVAAGDTVYVGPGVYREVLGIDVSGTSGNPITYIADVTGENTDGVGGIVRQTGSDNDLTAVRNNIISANGKDYRTFRGFFYNLAKQPAMNVVNPDTWIVEDCYFAETIYSPAFIKVTGTDQASFTIRRCIFRQAAYNDNCIEFSHSSTVDNTGHLIENCLFDGNMIHVYILRIGGITVNNCTFFAAIQALRYAIAPAGGQATTVNNCIIAYGNVGMQATAVGEFVENFNAFFGNDVDRTNTATGADSNTSPPNIIPSLLHDGVIMPAPEWPGMLNEWSQIGRIAGTSEATDDLFGITRPATSSKKSWGAIQLREGERDTATKRTGTASLKLADAGDHQMFLPVDGTEITISCYTLFETNYAGTKPQMIIRQPGQSDDVTLATGAVDTQELLTTTLTPSATPGYVVVIMRSNNTATSGSYATYFDDLAVS